MIKATLLNQYLKESENWRNPKDTRNVYIHVLCTHTILADTEMRAIWGIAVQAKMPGPVFDLTQVVIDSLGIHDMRKYENRLLNGWIGGKNLMPKELKALVGIAKDKITAQVPRTVQYGIELAKCMGHGTVRIATHHSGHCPQCAVWAEDVLVPAGEI